MGKGQYAQEGSTHGKSISALMYDMVDWQHTGSGENNAQTALLSEGDLVNALGNDSELRSAPAKIQCRADPTCDHHNSPNVQLDSYRKEITRGGLRDAGLVA